MKSLWIRAALSSAALCSLSAAAYAQAGAPAPPIPDSDFALFSGRVVRSDTAEPLKNVSISLFPVSSGSQFVALGAQTDQAGEFSIPHIPPGRYHLSVSHDGFSVQSVAGTLVTRGTFPLTLRAGASLHDVAIRMAPWAVIAGRITDDDGEPLPGARVLVLSSTFSRGKRRLNANRADTTNDLGEYRLWGLPPGRYYIRANYPARDTGPTVHEERQPGPRFAYPPTFYPGTTDANQAVAMNLNAGQQLVGIDIRLTTTPAFTVRGRVFDGIRSQPAGCCLVFSEANDPALLSFINVGGLDPTKGNFEIEDVTPGSYLLTAFIDIDGRQFHSRTAVNVAGADVDGVQVLVTRGSDLRGNVAVESGGTVNISAVTVELLDAQPQLEGPPFANVKADGSFVVTGVAEGTYEVSVFHQPAGAYVKSIRVAGQDALDNPLYVSQAGIKGSIEVVLSTAAATVDGVVVDGDGQPVPGAGVALAPDGERRKSYRLYRSAHADQSGNFSFQDLAPGDYSLFSWQHLDGQTWQDPEVLRAVEEKRLRVSVPENGHQSVQLVVIPGSPE